MKHIRRIALVFKMMRDACLIGVGVLALAATPPSLTDYGFNGPLSNIWALMMFLGATASLAGVLFRKPVVEVYGCSFVGGAFGVWAWAATARADATIISVIMALVFLSGTAGQGYRVSVIAEREGAA